MSKSKATALLVTLLILTMLPLQAFSASAIPFFTISAPNKIFVQPGGSVSYTVVFSGDLEISNIFLSNEYLTLNGFTANVDVTGDTNIKTITLSNIQGTSGDKTISIKSGAASDIENSETAASTQSYSFLLTSSSAGNSSDKDTVRPSISISSPDKQQIRNGETVSYVVRFSDNRGVASAPLNASHITMNNFTADVSISDEDGDTRTITLSNVQGELGGHKSIIVGIGAIKDAHGNENLATPASFPFAIAEIFVTLNGNVIPFDQQPIMENDRALVPLRAISESMGYEVGWDAETETIFISNGEQNLMLTIGGKEMLVVSENPQIIELDVAPKTVNDRTVVPIRAIAEGLKATVNWDDATQTIQIIK